MLRALLGGTAGSARPTRFTIMAEGFYASLTYDPFSDLIAHLQSLKQTPRK
jgi:hypothetical protein